MHKLSESKRAGSRLELTLLDVDEGRFRYNRCLNLTIGIWAGQATLESVQRVQRISQLMLNECPNGHSSVVFILDGAPAPTPEARVAFAQVLDHRTTDLSCTAVVVEGQGFWASGIRSAITNARMAAAGSLMLRVHDKFEELLDWFPEVHQKRTGVELPKLEFRRVLEIARARAASADVTPHITWLPPE